MNTWKIAWKNMLQRGVASTLTAVSMALGVAAMVCVLIVYAVTVRQFSQDAQGYHLIVGGKGGELQLVLSTVYHLGQPLYPIPWADYRAFVDGKYAPLTKTAVPYCLGDSFDPRPTADGPGDRLFRVVATTPDLFDKIEYGVAADGSPLRYRFSEGENFRADHAFEAVVGSVVAAQGGIHAGDAIRPTHGVSGEGDRHDEFLVTGVLAPTGTANDRAVFVNIEGFYLLPGHALAEKKRASGLPPLVLGSRAAAALDRRNDDPLRVDGIEYEVAATLAPLGTDADEKAFAPLSGFEPPAAGPIAGAGSDGVPTRVFDNDGAEIKPLAASRREVTSILVLCDNMLAPTALTSRINKDPSQAIQAVAPARVVTSLLDEIVGPLRVVLLALTVLVVVVAAIGVLVSIYNSMSERAHDIAVMRSLGASRSAVLRIILSEAVLLSVAGGAAGVALGHGLVWLAAPYVEAQTGVRLSFWQFDPWEAALAPGVVALAALAGLAPAVAAYRTDVARALADAR